MLTSLMLFRWVVTSSSGWRCFQKPAELRLSVVRTSCERQEDDLQPLIKTERWADAVLEASGYPGECWKGTRGCHMMLGWDHLCAPDHRSTWDQSHPPFSPFPLAYVDIVEGHKCKFEPSVPPHQRRRQAWPTTEWTEPSLPSLHIDHVQGVFQQPELHLVILSATGQVGRRGIHLQKPPARGGDDARRSRLGSNMYSGSHVDLRLEVLVQENVVPVELKAVLVVYNDLLDAMEAVHKYVIDIFEQFSNPLSSVLRGEVPANLLDRPLAYLCGSQRLMFRHGGAARRGLMRFLTYAPIQGHNLERFSECWRWWGACLKKNTK